MFANKVMRKVLIIDDEETATEILCKRLRRRGIDPTSANNLADGMKEFREQDFDCVVLDLGLPDSRDTMATAAHIPDFAPVPVIVFTGNEDKGLIRECSKMCAEYILKGDINTEENDSTIIRRIIKVLENTEPSEELENEIVKLERQRIGRAEPKKHVLVSWGTIATIVLPLMAASIGFGSWAYDRISGQATRDEAQRNRDAQVTQHLSTLDESVKNFSQHIIEIDKTAIEVQAKLSAGETDRQEIRRSVEDDQKQQADYRNEVIRRLERIEDHELDLLKGEKKP